MALPWIQQQSNTQDCNYHISFKDLEVYPSLTVILVFRLLPPQTCEVPAAH